ncbi:MAG: amidohydrolase family protein [Candidatus Binataceae bacterium]
MRQYQLISADDHVQEPPDTWQKRVPARFRDRAPKVVRTEQGDAWVIDGQATTLGMEVQAGKKFEEYKATGETYDSIRKGSFDPVERLKDMDIDGVDAQVLYSNTGTFRLLHLADVELQAACMRAYNDFLSEFCSTDLERLAGIGMVCADDVEEAKREAKRIATLPGLHGVILPLYPRMDPLNSDIYDPLWAVVQDLDLPVHVHVAVGDPRLSKPLGNDNPHIHGAYPAAMNDNFMGTYEALSKVIFGGMLERFPRLKFVLVEARIGWLPFFLERSDNVYQRHRHWSKLQLKEKPSFYFHRQVYATFIEDRAGIEARHRIGVGNIMWSSDYPHTDTTWPNSRKYIEDTFQGVNEEDRHKMLVGNAVKLYKL